MKPSKYLVATLNQLTSISDNKFTHSGEVKMLATAQITATLASSEEQRTANLLAYLPHASDPAEVLAEIERRLGL